jgi:hypothetical protein
MNVLGTVRVVLRVGTALSTVAAVRMATSPSVSAPQAPPRAEPLAVAEPAPPRANADSLARSIQGRDLFRLARRPAAVAFDPDRSAGAPAAPVAPPPQRPAFVLAGLILGPVPGALLDGLPGIEGTRVVHEGERIGAYIVRRIATDSLVIAGPDTTWVLKLRRAFP